ncbi:MAG: SH3 beta-barrel fold-containing protein [Sulfurihydrogenibium sp.]|jgi:hypothetical protein|nr:SH3 beta-barrel fold-containing protein [Sulfurihydrogenibium sp.]
MTYTEVSEIFQQNTLVKVVFTKADGTERTLIGTIKNIPEEHMPKGTGYYSLNMDVYRCFDVEADGWRSFRLDSVISISVDD